ncbi:MAG: hypothetical protein HRJ53_14515 [Acidobacteria bacterium Pan2503]|uniref:Uncharacterized protein n=1 Tax=Candidatus Acidiferrum panamense TaxID=2741543 RepID=A0A7V8NRI4_9BACT|nr:hypothetical protein [Candidatus Acidoferrum panamensis]
MAGITRKVHVHIMDPRSIVGVVLMVQDAKGKEVAAMGSPIQPLRPMAGDRLTIVFTAVPAEEGGKS